MDAKLFLFKVQCEILVNDDFPDPPIRNHYNVCLEPQLQKELVSLKLRQTEKMRARLSISWMNEDVLVVPSSNSSINGRFIRIGRDLLENAPEDVEKSLVIGKSVDFSAAKISE